MKRIISKTISTLSLLLLFMHPAYSQIGIYTELPDVSTVLDIESEGNHKGLLIPQLTTAQKTGIQLPAEGLLVYDTNKNCISQNLGSEEAPIWTCLTLFNRSFFYMPSVNIPTVTLGPGTLDLFGIYKNQFTSTSPTFRSAGAPAVIPQFLNATDLYYYVTYHNPLRITIGGIDANGLLSYTTTSKAKYDDYINIVFVVK